MAWLLHVANVLVVRGGMPAAPHELGVGACHKSEQNVSSEAAMVWAQIGETLLRQLAEGELEYQPTLMPPSETAGSALREDEEVRVCDCMCERGGFEHCSHRCISLQDVANPCER